MITVATAIWSTLTTNRMPPKTRNWLTWSTSLVTRETRAPRRSVFWVSTGRSWTWRKALIRSVARPRSALVKSRLVMKYDATAVTTIASAATRPITTMKRTSGPSDPLRPRSRVCWTTIGMTTWPMVASTARRNVPSRPSLSSGEIAIPRRRVASAEISSPVSTVEAAEVIVMRGPRGSASAASGSVGCSCGAPAEARAQRVVLWGAHAGPRGSASAASGLWGAHVSSATVCCS